MQYRFGRPQRHLRAVAVAASVLGVLAASAAPAAAGVNFAAPANYTAHSFPQSIAIGDLNGDGIPDLAVANNGGAGSGDVSVLLGAGAGSFSPATNYSAQPHPESIAIGDLNADGMPDLPVANAGTADVSVFLNTTPSSNALSFKSAANFGAHSQPISVAIGDLNGDGRPDLAVANNASSDVAVLLNTTPSGQTTPFFGGGATAFPAARATAGATRDVTGASKP